MSRQYLAAAFTALVVAVAMACTSGKGAPTSPSGLLSGGTGAAADGSTLKATAPAPTSPINGVRAPENAPTVLVVTNSSMPYTSNSGLTLSYRFELQNAAGGVIENALVPGGVGSTSRTVTGAMNGNETYRWRARAEFQEFVGPWSPLQSFVASSTNGYNLPGALYDPLVNGTTIGQINGNVTFVPGQGLRTNDQFSFVVYPLPQSYPTGEISVEVTGLGPNGSPGKARIFSILDRIGAQSSLAKHSINVQYRGTGGAPENCITWKAVLGDNDHSVEPPNRFANIYFLDPSKVYLWQGFWTPTSVRVVVKEGGATGPVLYNENVNATSGTTNWSPEDVVYAFIGTNNALYTGFDGTREGMIVKHLWVGATPRPANLP